MNRKGQGGISGAFIAIMVAVIIGVGVTIPIVQQTIDNSSITGMTATVLGYLPVILGIVLFVAAAALIR